MKQDVNILVLEPNKYHGRLIERELSDSYPDGTIAVFTSASAALGELRRRDIDIAIVSLDLPDVDLASFVHLVRQENGDLPIIVTGYGSPTEIGMAVADKKTAATQSCRHPATEAAKAGADEYLVKDSTFHQALPRLLEDVYHRRTATKKRLQLELRRKEEEHADLIKVTTGTLFHEINNPLMTILGTCDLILNNGVECEPEVAKKTRIIKRSARRIQSILGRLSSVSRPSLRETASGHLIDPRKSLVRQNTDRVKSGQID